MRRSQFNEDEYIEAVFSDIGFGSRVLVDIGARLECSNSANLIVSHEFQANLYEQNANHCAELRKCFPKANVEAMTVTPEIVNQIVPENTWFLTLDIDSCDWWVWANLRHKPALVVVETNPVQGFFVASYPCRQADPDGYGMSVDAAKWLGEKKGYDYIGRSKVNCFFVRKDLNCKYRLPEIKEHAGSPCRTKNNVF